MGRPHPNAIRTHMGKPHSNSKQRKYATKVNIYVPASMHACIIINGNVQAGRICWRSPSCDDSWRLNCDASWKLNWDASWSKMGWHHVVACLICGRFCWWSFGLAALGGNPWGQQLFWHHVSWHSSIGEGQCSAFLSCLLHTWLFC